jgi:hypothetical protein
LKVEIENRVLCFISIFSQKLVSFISNFKNFFFFFQVTKYEKGETDKFINQLKQQQQQQQNYNYQQQQQQQQ